MCGECNWPMDNRKAYDFGEAFERAARFWDPNQAGQPMDIPEYDEEMKKFTEGFAYKAPKFEHNMIRKLLNERPKGKISIIADDPEEQHLADQLALIVNHYREEEDA